MLRSKRQHHSYEALMRYARMLGFGDVHIKLDAKLGLHAIIAIHSTQLGPAIGGCRLYHYKSSDLAMKDALRLAYMMTLKAAVCDLPHGGAKSVIIKPPISSDRKAVFHAFGDFVHQMNGRYIAAMDVGTTTQDMDFISERTPHVIGAASTDPLQEDPAPYTALGLYRGMLAATQFKLKRDTMDGVRVALQGAGKVSYNAAKHLYQAGAQLTVCDINEVAAQKFVEEFGAYVVAPEEIYDVECDIFAPCALGGTLNLETIQRIRAPIIAGCANNQLAHRKFGTLLHEKNVLYVPDFVVNAGGLIQAACVHDYHDIHIALQHINQLQVRLLNLFERAASLNRPTEEIAELIAKEKLSQKQAVETT